MTVAMKMQFAFVVAMAVAAYLSASILVGTHGVKGLPGCGTGSGCAAVTTGRWSRWGSVPISGLGLVVYSLLLIAAMLYSMNFSARLHTFLAEILLTGALVLIGSIIWFVVLQAFVVRRFCAYCMSIHCLGAFAACLLLLTVSAPTRGAAETPLIIAASGLFILIAGQIVLTPKTFVVIPSVESQPDPEPLARVINGGEFAIRTHPVTNRHLKLRSGRVEVCVDDFPTIGHAHAPAVIACLFDHTCEECHHLHRLLLQAVEHFRTRLAVVTIPVPLNASCNPSIKCRAQERAYSCVYARLDWAMWTVDIDRHAEWVRFMAEEEQVKPFGLALQKANELADISRFKLREFDAELDKRIATGLEIHRMAGEPKIPALLLPAGMILGHIPTLNVMIETLEKHMSLPAANERK